MNLDLSAEDLQLVENVIGNVKKIFENEGIDAEVAKQLEDNWMKKLAKHNKENSKGVIKVDGSSEKNIFSDTKVSQDDEKEVNIAGEALDLQDTDTIDTDVVKQFEGSWIKKFANENKENPKGVIQVDGSSESDSPSDTEPSEVDEEEVDIEEEPLDSDDDVDVEDTDTDMVTDNVIFCKYTNVKRVGRKWSLSLTSGVMQLNGKHSVFGEAQVETWF